MGSRLRTRTLGAACSVTLLASLVGLGVVTSAPPAGADVANDPLAAVAYQENPAHDGSYTDSTFGSHLTKAWSVDLGGHLGHPIIANGLVFAQVAGSGEVDVEALSLATGDVVWGPKAVSASSGAGIAYDDGQVFSLNWNGQLSAFDAATGVKHWTIQMPGQDLFSSSPTAVDGTVYVGGAGVLSGVDEATGQITWSGGVAYGDNSSPTVGDGGVFVSYACDQAYRYNIGGGLAWHHATGCSGGGGNNTVLHDGRLYTRDSEGDLVLDAATGALVDTYVSGTVPAFDDGHMATQTGGALSIWNSTTGNRIWKSTSSDNVTAPLFANGYVIEGRADGTVEMRNEDDGSLAWSGSAGSEIDPANEYFVGDVVGLAVGDGALVVPAGSQLTTFVTGTPDPQVWIDKGPAQDSLTGSAVSFTFESNVADASYECTMDGATAPCTSPVTYTDLADGQHTFSVGVAGSSVTSGSRSFTSSSVQPYLVIDGGAQDGDVVGPNVTFSFESDTAHTSYECTMDGVTAPCTSPQSYPHLSDGAHIFMVRLTGTSVTETRTFRVDGAGPTVRLGRFRPTRTHQSTVTIHWSGSDPSGIASYQVRQKHRRHGVMSPWGLTERDPGLATSWTWGIPSGGRICVSVRAQDRLGNVSHWTTAQCVVRVRAHH